MDVSALYTKIFPKTRKLKLYKLPQKIYINITVITSFLTLILILDNFIFNGIQYLQTKGCAMGTKYAPTYANIFMGEFEEKYIYPKMLQIPNIYRQHFYGIKKVHKTNLTNSPKK